MIDLTKEFSAEREGITWIATPPDDTCSDYADHHEFRKIPEAETVLLQIEWCRFRHLLSVFP